MSALGINNSGELTMTYGYEDTDYKTKGDASTGYAFNAATSTFFCRIRDLFVDELRDMFVRCESDNAWSAEGLIKQFDEWQAEFPEELWRLDIERKYLRTYREGTPRFLTTMMQGRKKYQRRQFERNQEKYMATKFFGNVAVADQIMFRCNTPTGDDLVIAPDYTLYLTPYSDMYIDVLFGATYRTQVRAEAGKQYVIECPFTTMDDTAVLVYGASLIQSMGDLSACYIHDNEFSNATRLKELIIGNDTEGYQNSFLTNLGIGNNKLLEKLDIQNTPNLVQALNLSDCNNLCELYAQGSGLTGVTFADGGMIQIAELPAITSLTMKNLLYLVDLDITSLDNLTTLIVENCDSVNVQNILEQGGNINRVRITGIDWDLETTSLLEEIYEMAGVDKSGYNTTQSVLAGKVHVALIRQQQLYEYNTAWPDLEITASTIIEQFPVKFMNADGTILEIQYVDKGSDATDPVTEGRIPTPTKESSVSTDYTYAGWDTALTSVFSERTITATYTESVRQYTLKYVSKGTVLQESSGLYGDYIEYTGITPTYTAEESGYKYYLFKGWDKSGYLDGDKTVNAVFDSFEYTDTAFEGKELADLTNVELYALTKLGIENTTMNIEDGDDYAIRVGYDVDYDDIESELLVSDTITFDGTNYLDTGIQLFEEDRDFVLAIDFDFMSGTADGSAIAQCFRSNGSVGFKLWYSNGEKLTWCTSTSANAPGVVGYRDMLVLRHKKGESKLYAYMSNLSSVSEINIEALDTTKDIVHDSTLVFGCVKYGEGEYESHALGHIHWCKIWYRDLGEDNCKKLAGWTHEHINLEMCGLKRYYLTSDPNKRCTMSLLATHLLERPRTWNTTGVNAGGWADATLNSFLNKRLYEAMPTQTKLLMKQVTVLSSIGSLSNTISSSECYITIPALIELSATKNDDPYINEMAIASGKTISYMDSNEMRKRSYVGGNYDSYWTRSPNYSYSSYVWKIGADGVPSGYYTPSSTGGVLIEISF